MDTDASSSSDDSVMSLQCKEEFPWDMMYPWLVPVRKLVENNGMWVWSVDANLSVRVKTMLFGEEQPMIQVATIPCHEWALVADCERAHVILLIRGKPSFFIYPRDPRCDWGLVHRILNTYYVGITPLIQSEDSDEGKHVDRARFVPTLDFQERPRDQANTDVAGRGHYLAIAPVPANPLDRMPSVELEQVYHVHHTPGASPDLQYPNTLGLGFLNDTHSPRLSLSGAWDGVPRGDA